MNHCISKGYDVSDNYKIQCICTKAQIDDIRKRVAWRAFTAISDYICQKAE